MGLKRSRTITLIVAIATLTSNTFSSLLFAQLPDDPYHLANNFGWYLHVANILSVFGFIGALKQNPLSVAIFANYLILDTILSSVPRLLVLTLLNTLSSTLCSDPTAISLSTNSDLLTKTNTPSVSFTSATYSTNHLPSTSSSYLQSLFTNPAAAAGEQQCLSLLSLTQVTLAAGVIAATVLQFVGALAVREYGKMLWLKEQGHCDEEDIITVEVDLDVGQGYSVEEILENGLRNERVFRDGVKMSRGDIFKLKDEKEMARRERCKEEWGFRGLEVIVEENTRGMWQGNKKRAIGKKA